MPVADSVFGVLAFTLLVAGVVVLLICSAGVVVMKSPFDRLHYSSASAWGAALIALAILARESVSLIADKALAIAALVLVSSPVLVHLTARVARIKTRGAWNSPEGLRPHGSAANESGAGKRSRRRKQ